MRERSSHEGKLAAAHAIVERVRNRQTIGLGSGSTVATVLPQISRRLKEQGFKVSFVPSSLQIALKAEELGLHLLPLGETDKVDWTVDGADEVDADMRLVKGGGGALLRERILANLSDHYLVLVGEEKLSEVIGEKVSIPIELAPQALSLVRKKLKQENLKFSLRTDDKGYPRITESGNIIIDMKPPKSYDPEKLYDRLKKIPGVLEVGIFLEEADEVLIGRSDGTFERKMRR